jgi:PKD repeat protein
MTRIRRVAATAAFIVGTSALVGTTAHAAATSVIWVDNASGAGCVDAAGSGSQAQPFCTIQAAVNVAQAGQTVSVEPGIYNAQNNISTSGTASEPITIDADSQEAPVVIGDVAHAFDIAGASNIVISGFDINKTTAEPVLISGSSAVTVQKFAFNWSNDNAFLNEQIHVTGDSSGIDISQNRFWMSTTTAVQIDAGGSNDTVTTNLVDDVEGDGIVVDSTPGTNVVSNTVDDTCGSGIDVTDGSTGATIENNILADTRDGNTLTCPTSTDPLAGLEVDATSTSSTVANYNDVDTAEEDVVDYDWGGTTYATASAFDQATGQGAADANTSVLPDDIAPVSAPSEKSAAINSANSDAPGELATDMFGLARVDDPLVPNTGVGTYTYYDRGAAQRQDTVSFPSLAYPLLEDAAGQQVAQAPTGAPISLIGTAKSAWGGAMTYSVDFGDGSTPVTETDGTATHTYTTTGDFNVSMTATSSYEGELGFSIGITIVDTTADPQLTVTSTGAMSVSVDPANSTDPWGVDGYYIDFGDGYSTGYIDAGTTSVTHTYSEPGTYTITLTLNDAGNDNAQTTASFSTAGADFTAAGPSRILDTRKGIGAPKAPVTDGNDIVVKVAGVDSIPSDATAVAINLTATDTVGSGFVTGETAVDPGANVTPSNINFTAGQTVANNAILPIDANGDITLGVNGTSTSTAADLIGDVTGYFTTTSGEGYSPVTLDRLLDTRKGIGAPKAQVVADSGIPLTIAGADSIPSGVSAVAVHVTVVDTTGSGWIAAEPDGAGTPGTSILNYLKGQTVSNTVIVPVAADGKIELYNGGGTTPVDLLADVSGYFSASAPDAYYPVTPYRAWDTRSNGEQLTASGTETYSLTTHLPGGVGDFVIPANASLVTNLTLVDEADNGYITAYPAGTSLPAVSSLNYLQGKTLAGLALLPTTGSNQSIDVYNNSTGTTDLIMDVFGYFASN